MSELEVNCKSSQPPAKTTTSQVVYQPSSATVQAPRDLVSSAAELLRLKFKSSEAVVASHVVKRSRAAPSQVQAQPCCSTTSAAELLRHKRSQAAPPQAQPSCSTTSAAKLLRLKRSRAAPSQAQPSCSVTSAAELLRLKRSRAAPSQAQ